MTFKRHSQICLICTSPRGLRGQPPELAGRPFSSREVQIVHFVCQGKKNQEIGISLGICEGTVKSFLKTMFAKARVTNRTALAAWWLQKSDISPQSE